MILGRQRGRQNEPDKCFCLPTFQRSKSDDFGCAPASAAEASVVWWNLESPQHKLRDREQCAPGKKTHHITQPLFSHFYMAPHGKAVVLRARFRGSSQSRLRVRHVTWWQCIQSVLLVMCSEEIDISRQKSGLSRIRWCHTHTDKGTFPLLTRLWKNLRGSER